MSAGKEKRLDKMRQTGAGRLKTVSEKEISLFSNEKINNRGGRAYGGRLRRWRGNWKKGNRQLKTHSDFLISTGYVQLRDSGAGGRFKRGPEKNSKLKDKNPHSMQKKPNGEMELKIVR